MFFGYNDAFETVRVKVSSKLKEYMADFSLVLVALAWGLTFFPVQRAVEESPVYLFLFWRFLFATILMGLFTIRHWKKIDKITIQGGVILGVFLFLGFAFQTFALTHTYSSTVAFITGLNVVLVPFIVFLFFKNRVSFYSITGALFASLGLYLLSAQDSLSIGYGEFYALICAFMFAFQISFTAYYAKRCNIYMLVVLQFLVVAIFSLIGAIIFDAKVMPDKFSGVFLEAIIVTVLFATIFAFFVQTAMQRFTTPAKTAIIFTLEPVSAGVAGYYIANEILSSAQLFGAGLILLGVIIAETGTYFRSRLRSRFSK